MRKRSNFHADFPSLPKASWVTSCTQHGPVWRRKNEPGGAPGPTGSVPGATPEAVWSQKAARNHPDPLETSILDHFGDDFGLFLLIFVTHKWSPEPLKWPPENPEIISFVTQFWTHSPQYLQVIEASRLRIALWARMNLWIMAQSRHCADCKFAPMRNCKQTRHAGNTKGRQTNTTPLNST